MDRIFWNGGFDVELYVEDVFLWFKNGSDCIEDALHDFIYSQNYYLGRDLKIHRYV